MQFYIFSIAHLAPAVQSNQLNGEIEGKGQQVGGLKTSADMEKVPMKSCDSTSRDVGALR